MTGIDARVKGNILKGFTGFIKGRWGSDALAECEDRVGIRLGDVNEDKWYPNLYLRSVAGWVAETHGLDSCRKMGAAAVTERGVISHLARLAGFRRILEKGVGEFRDSFTFGDVGVELAGNTARVTFDGIIFDEPTNQIWLGAFNGMLLLTMTNGEVKQVEADLDRGRAVFEITWEARAADDGGKKFMGKFIRPPERKDV